MRATADADDGAARRPIGTDHPGRELTRAQYSHWVRELQMNCDYSSNNGRDEQGDEDVRRQSYTPEGHRTRATR